LSDIIELVYKFQEERKKTLNEDITVFDNFKNMYFIDRTRLDEIVKKCNGYKINKLHEDIIYLIDRMNLILLKIRKLYSCFTDNRDEFIMGELTELIYLFVSYSYSIMMINNEELNKNFKIIAFEKERQKRFDKDGIHNIVIGVLRNSFHHGRILHCKWLIEYDKEMIPKLSINFDSDELSLLVDSDGNQRLKAIGEKYIKEKDNNIDVLQLLQEYFFKVKNFFDWYEKCRNSIYKEDIELYSKYMKYKKNIEDEIKRNFRK